jgi:hypothetical protein
MRAARVKIELKMLMLSWLKFPIEWCIARETIEPIFKATNMSSTFRCKALRELYAIRTYFFPFTLFHLRSFDYI